MPNLLTISNLLCGCVGIVAVFEGEVEMAAYLIWLAAIFDFLDGFVARWLKAYSSIGKELDSLADMVTFGALPAIVMYALLKEEYPSSYFPWIAFSIAVFSALRLAKFNIDTRQTDAFIGLPTPANALFISALPFVIAGNSFVAEITGKGMVLIGITLIFSFLMVAEIRLFALKFKNRTWQDNKIRFVFIVLCVLLIFGLQIQAIPLIIISYLLLSIPGSRKHL